MVSGTAVDQTVFLTLVRTTNEIKPTRLLIDSLRSFGGALRACPVWVFEPNPQEAPCNCLCCAGVQVLPLKVPDSVGHYIFGEKVFACAQAEEMAVSEVRSLIWIDPSCLIVNPPRLFDLGPSFDAAVRPVHIRNVGLAPTQSLDGFWTKICAVVGAPDIPTTVETFVDAHRIRSYFNSHAFAIHAERGLLRRWLECFATLVGDELFQASSCQDERHQIFLHQAILSTLLVTSFDAERILILPTEYNYPYNLQGLVPPERRAQRLNDLVCITYEGRSLDPSLVDDIRIDEPLRSWLSDRARRWYTDTDKT